jgi:hypothetical protein
MNQLLETELTAFLEYEKYDRIGINSGNSRNPVYGRTLHTDTKHDPNTAILLVKNHCVFS